MPAMYKFIASTNKAEAIKPDKTDRRHCLIESSNELCKVLTDGSTIPEPRFSEITEYFNNIYAHIADEDSMRSLFEFLLNRPNLDGFGHRIPPRSAFHKEQQKVHVIEQWIRDLTSHYNTLLPDMQTSNFPAKECYTMFNQWKRENNPTYELGSLAFGNQLRRLKIVGITSNTDRNHSKTFDWYILSKLLTDK
jgi:hypothetical protein